MPTIYYREAYDPAAARCTNGASFETREPLAEALVGN